MSFSEAIRTERVRCRAALPDHHRVFSYVDRGFYAEQVRRYQRYFTDEQLCFIPYENFRDQPEQTMNTIFTFLDVDATNYHFVPQSVNKTNYPQKMEPADRQYLMDVYQNDIKTLEQLLGWDCSPWLR